MLAGCCLLGFEKNALEGLYVTSRRGQRHGPDESARARRTRGIVDQIALLRAQAECEDDEVVRGSGLGHRGGLLRRGMFWLCLPFAFFPLFVSVAFGSVTSTAGFVSVAVCFWAFLGFIGLQLLS